MQEIKMPVVDSLPMLKDTLYYLAVPQPGQPWQMAIFDQNTKQWRAIDINELQALAQKMGAN